MPKSISNLSENSITFDIDTAQDVSVLVSSSAFVCSTRSYAALRAADLSWIVGPGYSLGGYILEKNHEKPTWNHEKL